MKSKIWYPYTQHHNMAPPIKITHTDGVRLYSDTHPPLIDAISSWWSTIHGYNHPELNQALVDQSQKMSHVMLGGITHEPAEKLAEKLVEITPKGLNHVFFSDSGSVAVEVALKMALQYWHNQGHPEKNTFVALKRGYHGDTCGVMSIGDPEDGMHASFTQVLKPQIFLDAPKSGYPANETILNEEIDKIRIIFNKNYQFIAAVVVEPLMQGAGGFNLYSPEYLNTLYKLCQEFNILMIFDEVATGFGRTGTMFAADRCDFCPDILCVGKALTGGTIGHAATLATAKVFDAFYSPQTDKALMHGPTFMGNPLACAVALKSIEIFEKENYLEKIATIEQILKTELADLTAPHIKEVRILGAMAVIEYADASLLKNAGKIAQDNGVWLRPFSNVLYTMPAYITKTEDLIKITDTLKTIVKQTKN